MRQTFVGFGSGYGRANSGFVGVGDTNPVYPNGVGAGGGIPGAGGGSGYYGSSSDPNGVVAGGAFSSGSGTAPIFIPPPFGSTVGGGGDGAGPYSITLSDVIRAGSVEGAANIITRDKLLRSVSELSAGPIVNVLKTLSGVKDFDPADWASLGSACKVGQFEMGLLDSADRVQVIFAADGTAYVNATNADGFECWGGLSGPNMTNVVEAQSQQGIETPQAIAGRLGGIARAAQTPISGSRLMGGDRAYKQYGVPQIWDNSQLKFERPVLYSGVTASIPDLPYRIVCAKKIE